MICYLARLVFQVNNTASLGVPILMKPKSSHPASCVGQSTLRVMFFQQGLVFQGDPSQVRG